MSRAAGPGARVSTVAHGRRAAARGWPAAARGPRGGLRGVAALRRCGVAALRRCGGQAWVVCGGQGAGGLRRQGRGGLRRPGLGWPAVRTGVRRRPTACRGWCGVPAAAPGARCACDGVPRRAGASRVCGSSGCPATSPVPSLCALSSVPCAFSPVPSALWPRPCAPGSAPLAGGGSASVGRCPPPVVVAGRRPRRGAARRGEVRRPPGSRGRRCGVHPLSGRDRPVPGACRADRWSPQAGRTGSAVAVVGQHLAEQPHQLLPLLGRQRRE
ncbi:hypothetical protein Amir_2539 [Actinosynnema mirum DSM 43827]|uniref:Uncharacterized protein n=1 Tax=Actinosynnema mirum (strain ATCC 29888 / DSM 43827 / JCM 3225 / NBRC 14064 / NCIMB 13271 / NRRL B-12336 / IMRU 3971 / 101) TaxID=446462 RepID=C6WLC3_ACTMD|nr:hypothetical protein Amir_2539 [Actinosynnema mirum DSM 43827]